MPEWKPVVGFEGFYSVSNDGQIMRTKSASNTRAGKILRPTPNTRTRRMVVTLRAAPSPRKQIAFVHRLVARAFLGEPPENMEVNHKDGNPQNNHVDNLEYVTRQDNMRHACKMGLQTQLAYRPGERHPLAKLTDLQAKEIRHSSEMGTTLAIRFGVSKHVISRIRLGRSYKNALSF